MKNKQDKKKDVYSVNFKINYNEKKTFYELKILDPKLTHKKIYFLGLNQLKKHLIKK